MARRTTARRSLTLKSMEAAQPVPDRDIMVHDTRQPGLVFRVRPSGGKAFYLYRKHRGRPVRLKLGDFPGLSVDEARRRCADAIKQMRDGVNPADQRRRERGELTLASLFALYQQEHLRPRCTEQTIRQTLWLYKKHLPTLHTRRLSDISPARVRELHRAIGERSRVSANRCVELLRRLLRYAIRHHGHTGAVPTDGVAMFREESRSRFLNPDELRRLFTSCDAEGQPWADFFRLSVFTGARRSNLQAMAWHDLDLSGGVWTIPAAQAKSGREMRIPLVPEAMAILERRRAEQSVAGDDRVRLGRFVFPALRLKVQGKTEHLSQPQRPWVRICKRAGLEGVRIHDLRRTTGSLLAAAGVSLPVIGAMLGHADLRATQIYSRLDLGPVRAAMATAAKAIGGEP